MIFLVAIGLRAVGFISANTFIPTFLVLERRLLESFASLILSLGPFTAVLGSFIIGSIGDRVTARKLLSLAMLSTAFALLAFSLVSDLYVLVFAYLILSFFNSIAWTPMNTLVAQLTPAMEIELGIQRLFPD